MTDLSASIFFPRPVILKEAVQGPSPSFFLSALILALENNILTEMSKSASPNKLCTSVKAQITVLSVSARARACVRKCVCARQESVRMCSPCPYCAYTLVFSVTVCHFEKLFLLLFQMRGIKRLRSSHLRSSPLQTTVLHTLRARSHPTPASNNKALALRIDLSLKDSLADTICSVSSERN